MYNTYSGQQQPQGQQGYQSPYQIPQQTSYPQPPQQQQQQPQFQQPQYLQNQTTGYGLTPSNLQPGQYGVPPVPAVPSQYAQQPQQMGLQPTGMQPQQYQQLQQPPPQQQLQSAPPPMSPPGTHNRNTSTAMGTSARIPNVRLTFLTTQDQIKFEHLFRSAVGSEQALEGSRARDILLRSKLNPNVLSQIWQLSDTTKSGKLLFPEFALAMYLCSLKITGKELPDKIPEKIMNEVSSMVDIISFGVPDNAPTTEPRSNIPNFEATTTSKVPNPPAQPPQSNLQTLSSLATQPSGYHGFGTLSAQTTGFPGQGSPQQGFTPQQTGFQSSAPNLTFQYTGGPPQSGLSVPGLTALQSQPTGRPGQWGFVNAPAGSMAGIQALQQQLMPQPGREGGFSSTGLQGSANIPWAITKDEKTIYDGIFQAWDGLGKGYIGGETAIEVFRQSGLPRADLERIWTLADPGNKGKLDRDEFAVALHLIYRRLNGYEIPVRLPPELIPPSSRAFANSVGQVKSFLRSDISARQKVGLTPQITGYSKARSFREDPVSQFQKQDATVYRFNDDEVGYRSSARRRGGPSSTPSLGTRSPSPSENSKGDEIQRLRKEIREKQILLDAVDIRDEASQDDDAQLDRRDRQDADDLYRRIRRLQEEIDSLPNASTRSLDSGADKRALRRQLQNLSDRLPQLASDVRDIEKRISEAKLRLFRMRDTKEHPGTAITGTGPNGEVTEGDRRKAKANAMLQARMAALTGKPAPATSDDFEGAARRLAEETERVKRERETNERMIQGIEESAEQLKEGLERSLKDEGQGDQGDHERRRWEEALGVEDEVRDFIFDLQRQSRDSRPKARSPVRREEPRPAASVSPTQSTSAPRSTASPSSYSNFKTAEERAAWVKQQAQQRMNERLAALGIRPASKPQSMFPPEPVETKPQSPSNGFARTDSKREQEETARKQREEQERARREREESEKQAERARQEEQRRKEIQKLQEEEARLKAEQETQKLREEEAKLKAEQEAQERRRKEIEEQERLEEEELLKEKAAQEERVKALQREVEAGKARKAREAEEARQREAQRQMNQREERLKAMRAEVEARKEEERRLQMEQEALEREIVVSSPWMTEEAPAAPAQEKVPISSPPPREVNTSPSTVKSGTNPFLRLDANPPPVPAATGSSDSTNPFFRIAAQSSEKPSSTPVKTTPISTRPRANSDDWDLVPSDEEEGSDDEFAPAGKRAVDLASMLFGGMSVPTRAVESPTPSTPTSNRPAAQPEVEVPPAPPAPPPPPPAPTQPSSLPASDFSRSEPPPRPPFAAPPVPFSSAPPVPGIYGDNDYFNESNEPPPPPMAAAPPPPPPFAPPFGAPPPPPSSSEPSPPFGGPPPPPPTMGAPPPPPPTMGAPPPPPPPTMGAPPPPPPPTMGAPPPPPPMMGAPAPPTSFGSPPAPSAPSGGGLSGALLSSIQKGKALKKVQTVDKSAPATAGRVI